MSRITEQLEFRDPILQGAVLEVEELLSNDRELTEKLAGVGLPRSPLRRLAMEIVSRVASKEINSQKAKLEIATAAIQKAYDNLVEVYSQMHMRD